MRFTICDMIWLTALVAVWVAWWVDHARHLRAVNDAESRLLITESALKDNQRALDEFETNFKEFRAQHDVLRAEGAVLRAEGAVLQKKLSELRAEKPAE